MPRWIKPSEDEPAIEVGDRIVIITAERVAAGQPKRPRLVILEATETGWFSPDPMYAGYTLDDGVLWSDEKSVCAIAVNLCPEYYED